LKGEKKKSEYGTFVFDFGFCPYMYIERKGGVHRGNSI
jgi:hypothetical protein